MTDFQRIETAAHAGAMGINSLPEPTAAQLAAGNYKVGRVRLYGIALSIEQPRGSVRTGINGKTGKRWSNRLAAHYGYIVGTRGNDGDCVDCFIGHAPRSEQAFVINQALGGRFDEAKVMLAFPDADAARLAYLGSYDRGWTGLESLVPLSVTQLKWWLKHGDMRRPLRYEQLPAALRREAPPAALRAEQLPAALSARNLPPEGPNMAPTQTAAVSLRPVQWDAEAQPFSQTLDQVLYTIRRVDGPDGLLLDSVSMADIMEDADGVLLFDALVSPFARLPRKMELLKGVLDKAGSTLKTASMQISDPYTGNGVAQVAVIFELTDGQTVTVFFHNPDVKPKQIAPTDELISWKWLLNKRDITIVVAPEHGADLNLREVARRIIKLAEKNSPAFTRANGKKAETFARIEGLKTEIVVLEGELAAAQHDLEVAKVEAEDRAAKAAEFDPTSPDGYAEVLVDPALQLRWQDRLDSFLQDRIAAVREELRALGWGNKGLPVRWPLVKDGGKVNADFTSVGAGRNVVAVRWNGVLDDLTQTPEALAAQIDAAAVPAVEPAPAPDALVNDILSAFIPAVIERMSAGRDRINETIAAEAFQNWWNTNGKTFADRAPLLQLIQASKAAKALAYERVLAAIAEQDRQQDERDAAAVAGIEPSTTHQGPLPWIGSSTEDETRWYGTTLRLSARDPKQGESGGGTMKEGDATLTRVLNRGTVLEVKWAGNDYSNRMSADRYLIQVVNLVDGKAGAPEPTPVVNPTPVPTPAAGRPYPGRWVPSGAPGSAALQMEMANRASRTALLTTLNEKAGWPYTDDEIVNAADDRIDAMRDYLLVKAGKAGPLMIDAEDADAGIAKVDAAYPFESATVEFKVWVAESVDQPDYSPFASAKAMDMAAKANGATVEWGLFGGAALDACGPKDDEPDADLDACGTKKTTDDASEELDPNEPEPDQDEDDPNEPEPDDDEDDNQATDSRTGSLFDSSTWKDQPRNRVGQWRLTRRKAAGRAARKVMNHITSAAARAHNHVKALFATPALDGVDPSVALDGYVGKILKDGAVVGRIDIGDDGKAMVFVGPEGDVRVTGPSGLNAMYSDDDAPLMVGWLFAGTPAVEPEPEPDPKPGERTVRSAFSAVWKLLIDDSAKLYLDDPRRWIRKADQKMVKTYPEFGASQSVANRFDGRQVTIGAASADAIEEGATLIARVGKSETRIAIDKTTVPEAVYKQVVDFFTGADEAADTAFTASLAPSPDLADEGVQDVLTQFKAGDFTFQPPPAIARNTSSPAAVQDSDAARATEILAAKATYNKAARAFLEGDMALVAKPKKNGKISWVDIDAAANIRPKPIARAVKAAIKPADVLAAVMVQAADNDVRYYLNGVFVDTEARCLVSTNGHRLLIVKTDVSPWENTPADPQSGNRIIGRDGKPINGKYPDYMLIVRAEKPTDKIVKVNAAKLAARMRGIVEAQKLTDAKWNQAALIVGGVKVEFSPLYLLEMAETFLRFKVPVFTLNVTANAKTDALVARSPDGRVTQIVMPQNTDGSDRFAPVNDSEFADGDVGGDVAPGPVPVPASEPAPLPPVIDPVPAIQPTPHDEAWAKKIVRDADYLPQGSINQADLAEARAMLGLNDEGVAPGEAQKWADRALFQSVVDGTVDALTVNLDELEAAALRNQDDPELSALFEQAVNVVAAAEDKATAGV